MAIVVDISNIVDRKSLLAWLDGKPHSFAKIVSHRAAMRVAPIYLDFLFSSENAATSELTALPLLWVNLATGTLAYCSLGEAKNEIGHNLATTLAFADGGEAMLAAPLDSAFTYAIDALTSAAYTVIGDMFLPNAAAAVSYAAEAFAVDASIAEAAAVAAATENEASVAYAAYIARSSAATAAFWEVVQRDCMLLIAGEKLQQIALWPNVENPLEARWGDISTLLNSRESDWSFWIKWYLAALRGEKLSCEMLRLVAQAAPAGWTQEPAYMSKLIAEIARTIP